MRLGELTGSAQVDVLNRLYEGAESALLVQDLLRLRVAGRLALVSSFGAEAAVLLHLVARAAPETPIFFMDTGKHFEDTLAYRKALTTRLGLTNVIVLSPSRELLGARDPDGRLHRRDPDACCAIRKVAPLQDALRDFDGWITGRKRFQTNDRQDLPIFEVDGDDKIKVNPLANWTPHDLAGYVRHHDLPLHPLVSQGFPSIGCAPCTARPMAGESNRSGRWQGLEKEECGIHFVDGRVVRIS